MTIREDKARTAALVHRLRELLFEGIGLELEIDDHHKSYEGAVDIVHSYPSYFERDEAPVWIVKVHCYVLGPSRHYEWQDKDLSKALGRAILEVEGWVEESRERYREEVSPVLPSEKARAS